MKNIFRIFHSGKAFGDNLFCAYVVEILRLAGFQAYLDNRSIEDLVPCERYCNSFKELHKVLSFDCVRRNRTGLDTNIKYTVFTDLICQLNKKYPFPKTIECNLNHIPVNYSPIDRTEKYDVVLVSKTGWWTPYREWPYFRELKSLFDDNGITYIDASQSNIQGNNLLNLVDKCGVYLGLETGVSHYVSRVANGKSIIIQSGYAPFEYWAGHYDYECIDLKVNCAPCWRRQGCDAHECMYGISSKQVLKKVLEKLQYK